jgi:beta-lactamase superfamily II metal-dependent hydrolase
MDSGEIQTPCPRVLIRVHLGISGRGLRNRLIRGTKPGSSPPHYPAIFFVQYFRSACGSEGVTHRKGGKWAVIGEGDSRASSLHDTQAAALKVARPLAEANRSELVTTVSITRSSTRIRSVAIHAQSRIRSTDMGYEIDFLPVGEKKSGDAIALRFGDLYGPREQQTVVVIDGGYVSDGKSIVDHLSTYYGTDHIDVLVSTHPDADHIGGLETVLANCHVNELWMHRPWNHTADIAHMFRHGRVTDMSVRQRLRESLEGARSLEAIAFEKGVRLVEPFAGVRDSTGSLVVIGPTKAYYRSLLPDFRCTPTPKTTFEQLVEKLVRATTNLAEGWHIESLTDSGETSAENNSSVILMLTVEGRNLLFTADAGIPALTGAVNLLDGAGVDRNRLSFVQVPHHGSRRNVGPTILDRLLGPKLAQDQPIRTAYVSVAIDAGPKHPSKRVLNAFRRRGTRVYPTAGNIALYYHNAPPRYGWGPLVPAPFHEGAVEEDGDE